MSDKITEALKRLWGYESIEQFMVENKALQEWFAHEAQAVVMMNAHNIALPTLTPEKIEGLRRQAAEMIAALAFVAQAAQAWKPLLDAMKRERQLMTIEEADARLREYFGVGIEDYIRKDEPCQIQELETTM